MQGFMEFLYVWLAQEGVISEDSSVCVEDLTMDFVTGDLDLTQEDVMDAWAAYTEECQNAGEDPVNDVEGFDPQSN